jgi:hypothetical protein
MRLRVVPLRELAKTWARESRRLAVGFISLVTDNDWLLVSQVSEGAHFRKTAVTSKKAFRRAASDAADADPAEPSIGAGYSFSA